MKGDPLYGSSLGTMAQLSAETPRSTFTAATIPTLSIKWKRPARSSGPSANPRATAKTNNPTKGMLRGITSDYDLVFHPDVYTAMIDHCLREKPLEACGLLSGKDQTAFTCWPMTNILHSHNAFEMDTGEIEDVFRKIREKEEQLVGIYHSHPTAPPNPSLEDIAHANYPEAAYVIVSLSDRSPNVRCFQILKPRVFPLLHGISRY
jgi:proteasome lid subunit RPN8/RPN11